MNQNIVKSINSKVYRRFPEVKGKSPKIQEQRKHAKALDSSSTYLLVYSSQIKTSGNKTMLRYIRVVANEKGKILKISTSR